MPTLRFHAIETDKLLTISSRMLDELVDIVKVPADYFNFEVIHSDFIERDHLISGFPIVEIHAFERSTEIEEAMARCISKYLRIIDYTDSEVYFIHLSPIHYYNNGQHY